MSRNRKRKPAALRFGVLLWCLLFCLIATGACLGYVWQKDQNRKLGQRLKELEETRKRLMSENEHKNRLLGDLMSEEAIERQVKNLGLGLVEAQPAQFWRLKEPFLAPVPSRVAAEYAARGGGHELR